MSTHMPGFRSLLDFLHYFVLAKLATSSIRVKVKYMGIAEVAIDLQLVYRFSRNSSFLHHLVLAGNNNSGMTEQK